MRVIDVFQLSVWTRGDRGRDEPTDYILTDDRQVIGPWLKKFIESHRDLDDYLSEEEKDEEYEHVMVDILKQEDEVAPGLNSIYFSSWKTIKMHISNY
jgi:hypothetical protein